MWQALYAELGPKGFLPIAVAFDSRGVEASLPWIEAAKAEYPCLIDRQHLVADLYDMPNVPIAAWIDEEGRIVRPPEPAGSNDAFRTMDHTTGAMPKESLDELRNTRRTYLDGLRDWVSRGAESPWVLSPADVLARMQGPTDERALAAANFRMGEHLYELGLAEAAQPYLAEARRLNPDSWAIRRQSWNLEHPLKAGGPEFWAAVDALREKKYYAPIVMPERS